MRIISGASELSPLRWHSGRYDKKSWCGASCSRGRVQPNLGLGPGILYSFSSVDDMKLEVCGAVQMYAITSDATSCVASQAVLPTSCTGGNGASITATLAGTQFQVLVYGDSNMDFTLSHKGCAMCTCMNGIAATGLSCEGDGVPYCIACDAGYHLVSGTCVSNTCTCSNGQAATGPACWQHDTEICEQDCQQNQCTCSNGQAARGEDCGQDSTEVCERCNPGFLCSASL